MGVLDGEMCAVHEKGRKELKELEEYGKREKKK